MAVKRLADFAALQPFFRIIQEGLTGVVDGGHFFELFAEDAITEFVITVPGYPKTIQGAITSPSSIAGMARLSFWKVQAISSSIGIPNHRW
jgi:hypothetical protein